MQLVTMNQGLLLWGYSSNKDRSRLHTCASLHIKIIEARRIDLSPNPGHVALHVAFLTSFYYDVIIKQPFDGPFDCDVIMEKSANRCDVGSLVIRQFYRVYWF